MSNLRRHDEINNLISELCPLSESAKNIYQILKLINLELRDMRLYRQKKYNSERIEIKDKSDE